MLGKRLGEIAEGKIPGIIFDKVKFDELAGRYAFAGRPLLGTYKNQADKGHEGMTIGLSQFRDTKRLTLPWLIILPFVGDPGAVPINRH